LTVDWHRIVWIELAILGGCAVAYVSWIVLERVLHTALLLLMAAVLAFALGPLVKIVQQWVGRRGVAVAILYLLLLLALGAALFLLSAPFVSQSTALLVELPKYAATASTHVPEMDKTLHEAGVPVTVSQIQTELSNLILTGGSSVVGGTLAVLGVLTGTVVDLVLIIVMSLYLLIDAPRFRNAARELVPASRRANALFVEETVTRVAGGYLRGQIIMSLTIGIFAGLGALLFNLQYPVVIAVFAGVMELIPMFGPVLGALPALLLALLNPFPTVLWVALYFIAVQQVESNILGPRITGHAVGLHPLGALLALLVGFDVAGVLGAVFAVPVVGIIWVLVAALYHRIRYGAEQPVVEGRGWRLPRRRSAANGAKVKAGLPPSIES
jgi:predicted PurR-regulated permease PerM